MSVARRMTVLRVTVPGQYFCTKHPDLNITAREIKNQAGTDCPCLRRNIHLWTTVETEEAEETVETEETVEAVQTVETVETAEAAKNVYTEDLKKYELLTHLLTQ